MEQRLVKHSVCKARYICPVAATCQASPELQRLNINQSVYESSVLSQKAPNKKLCVTYQLAVQLP